MPKAATKPVEYVELSREAAAAFDRYEEQRREKAEADKSARAADKLIKTDRDLILEELGEAKIGRLPDGRVIAVDEKQQERSAQPAMTVTWKTIVCIEGGS